MPRKRKLRVVKHAERVILATEDMLGLCTQVRPSTTVGHAKFQSLLNAVSIIDLDGVKYKPVGIVFERVSD